MRTIVLGGYGNFGARICRALAEHPGIELLVAGRNLARAQTLVETLVQTHESKARALEVDVRAPDLDQIFQQYGVDLVIHAAGPFQDQSYDVATAAAIAGAHYIDLADGRRFVCDFPGAVHTTFLAAGRTGICGASTVPSISAAVVDHLSQGWSSIDTIEACIAPAQSAPRGEATLAGVMSYCGKDVSVWRDGCWQDKRGWGDLTRVKFPRMKKRLGALCDIPDLEIFPNRYNVKKSVNFLAALEVSLAQRAFAALSALRSVGLIPPPARWAGAINRYGSVFDRLGSDVGGMSVRVTGLDADGAFIDREWNITAPNNHGPEIPCMPAILTAWRLADGDEMQEGGFTAAGLFALADFEPAFDQWGMTTEVVTHSSARVEPQADEEADAEEEAPAEIDEDDEPPMALAA